MKSPYSSVDGSSNRKVLLGVYILLEVIIAILIVVSLFLNWFNYCLWEFGIYEVDFIDDIKGYDNPDTISELQSDSCDNYDDTLDSICNDFCDNVDKIITGSDIMIILSTFTLVDIITTITFYVVRMRNSVYRFRIVPFISLFQSILYSLAILLYFFIGDFQNYDDQDCEDHCDDYTMKSGAIMAIANAGILIVINAFGFLFTRKAFI